MTIVLTSFTTTTTDQMSPPQVHAIFRIGIGQFAPKTKSRGTTLETNPTNGHVGGAAMDGSRQLQQYNGNERNVAQEDAARSKKWKPTAEARW